MTEQGPGIYGIVPEFIDESPDIEGSREMERERFPLNAPGDFYVEKGMCMACEAPEHEAPELMSHDPDSFHCYFQRQPATTVELEHAIMAMRVSCCAAVRYGGSDPNVIRRIEVDTPGSCDRNQT